MVTYANWLFRACNELGLSVDFGYVLRVGDEGRELHPLARVIGLGAPNGMLLFSSAMELQGGVSEEILHADYGYSVVDEPRPDEQFDLESFQEMFSDWGWCGDKSKRPDWVR